MNIEEAARQLAALVRESERGFFTIGKDKFRDQFGVAKLGRRIACAINDALRDESIDAYPHPYHAVNTLRLYDMKHRLGEIAQSVLYPDEITDAPLRHAAESFRQEEIEREPGSHEISWLEGLDLFLQVAIGREPECWKDVRNHREHSELARDLARALGLEETIHDAPWMRKLAGAVCCARPFSQHSMARQLSSSAEDMPEAESLQKSLEERNRRLHDAHAEVLRNVANLLLAGREIPGEKVKVGFLGLRRSPEKLY